AHGDRRLPRVEAGNSPAQASVLPASPLGVHRSPLRARWSLIHLPGSVARLRASFDPRLDLLYRPGRARFRRAERLLRHLANSLEPALLAAAFGGALGSTRGAPLGCGAFAGAAGLLTGLLGTGLSGLCSHRDLPVVGQLPAYAVASASSMFCLIPPRNGAVFTDEPCGTGDPARGDRAAVL